METKNILLQIITEKGLSQEELAGRVFVTRQLICQCCGMPLEDAVISKEPDGTFNEEYCKWCYTDGEFKYESPEQLIEFCVEHMASDAWPKEQVRAHMEAVVPQLRHWKK